MKFSMRMSAANFTKRYSILFVTVLYPFFVQAQFVIAEGTALTVAPGSDITIVSNGDVVNTTTDNFSTINLRLILVGNQDKAMEGNFVLRNLDLGTSKNDNGSTTLQGDVTVTDGMAFKGGVLRVPETSFIIFTGAGDQVRFNVDELSDFSYVDGIFYQKGVGERRFPIGKGDEYLPFVFTKVADADTIGVEAFAEPSGISPSPSVVEVDQSRYWQVYCNNFENIKSTVQLYKLNHSLSTGGTVAAVEADPAEPGIPGQYLGNAASPEVPFVVSQTPAKHPLLALGKIAEVTIRIHDLITPFNNDGSPFTNSNDALHIEFLFEKNRVVLMDRWGVVLREWTNYKNGETDLEYFKTLMPGNYICVVECEDPEGKKYNATQMVTVLKTK